MRNFFGYRLKFGNNVVKRNPSVTPIHVGESKLYFRTPNHHTLDDKTSLRQENPDLIHIKDNSKNLIIKLTEPFAGYSADMFPELGDIYTEPTIKLSKQSGVDKSLIFKSILPIHWIESPNLNQQYGKGATTLNNENVMLEFFTRCRGDFVCMNYVR